VLARYTGAREPDLHKLIIRDIIDREVHNLVATSANRLPNQAYRPQTTCAGKPRRLFVTAMNWPKRIGHSGNFCIKTSITIRGVAEVNRRACEMLRRVFEAYLADPDRLGEGATRRVEKEGLHRTVCDYIAGMTDRYVMEEYTRIAGP